ncbi:MAG: hypothetical protein ACI37V_04880 [Methanobrevibacter sp.]
MCLASVYCKLSVLLLIKVRTTRKPILVFRGFINVTWGCMC